MSKKYNSRLVHSYISYKIADICRLYKDIKLHPQTIRKWIKSGDLKAFEHAGEFYVYGAILKQFFENKSKTQKSPLEFNQFRCGKCKTKDVPLDSTFTKIESGRGGCIVVFGICKVCGHEMNRPYSNSKEGEIRKIFKSKLEAELTLCNTSSTTKSTHIENIIKRDLSDSVQDLPLFNYNNKHEN
jgi:hypothetical protein